jgi:hypothetical protein
MGLGIQSDTGSAESAIGLSGLNVGLGGWATDKLAIVARIVGTNVPYDVGVLGEVRQVSGVAAPAIQFWPGGRGYLEAGVGLGFWDADGFASDSGVGLVLGAGFSILNRGKHNLVVGVAYVPVFTDTAVHNFGINFGYQLW